MQRTKVEKAEMTRFGCTLRTREGALYIDWPKDQLAAAKDAQVLIRFVSHKHENGSLFCLGLEVSASRFLPRYCYYPFDLAKETHRKILEGILNQGSVRCIFVAGSKAKGRDIHIPPSHLPRILARYKKASSRLEGLKPLDHDFAKALAELETTDRLPDYFARVVSENELGALLESIKEDAGKVSPEKRALARQFFEGLFEVMRTRYPGDVRLLFDNLEAYRGFVQIVSDLYRDYGEDYKVIVHALADLAAKTSEKEELETLSPLPKALDSFCELLERLRSSPQADRIEIFHRLAAVLEEIRSHLATGAGLSQTLFRKTLPLLGPQVHGKPGRRPGDYSPEYERKAAGDSWAKVAKWSLENLPELQEEFVGRTFEELDFRQRVALRNRVRERVRGFALRSDKPFPPRTTTTPQPQGAE